MVTSWSPQAQIELQKAYNYIKNYSIQNAEKEKIRLSDIVIAFLSILRDIQQININKIITGNIGLLKYFINAYHTRL